MSEVSRSLLGVSGLLKGLPLWAHLSSPGPGRTQLRLEEEQEVHRHARGKTRCLSGGVPSLVWYGGPLPCEVRVSFPSRELGPHLWVQMHML